MCLYGGPQASPYPASQNSWCENTHYKALSGNLYYEKSLSEDFRPRKQPLGQEVEVNTMLPMAMSPTRWAEYNEGAVTGFGGAVARPPAQSWLVGHQEGVQHQYI